MKGDISRLTFRKDKRYSSVRLQQGRVQLDADWNEQIDIQTHRDRTTTRDTVGACGAPRAAPGFEISVSDDGKTIRIGRGRYYVNGILCENGGDADLDFTAQPDLPLQEPPLPSELPIEDGSYLAYLDVWQRHITAAEDSAIREVALGGPDTATRTKTVWQVKLEKVDDAAECHEIDEAFIEGLVGAKSTGALRAQAQPQMQPGSIPIDPCVVPPGAGYRGLENQLYRVEVYNGSDSPDGPTFLWARNNASTEARLINIRPDVTATKNIITVSDAGKDSVLGFASDQWVELSDEGRKLRGETGVLVKVDSVNGDDLMVSGQTDGEPLTMDRFRTRPTVRRWDSEGSLSLEWGTWRDLEDGVQVEFAEGKTYRTGDHWLIPARTVSGEVEWPRSLPDAQGNSQALFEESHGTEHHYRPLALLELADSTWKRKEKWDCRKLFPPLADLTASDVQYTSEVCTNLVDVSTVQEAIDELCKTGSNVEGIRITGVRTLAPDEPLRNDATVPVSALAEGLRVRCDTPVDPAAVAGELFPDAVDDPTKTRGKPTCFVTLDVPYPFSNEDKALWGAEIVGYQPLILRGQVAVADRDIIWTPAGAIKPWLEETLFERMAQQNRGDRILAHLTLNGNFIWAKNDRDMLLDGETYWEGEEDPTGLGLPSGDNRRGGNFEMWFWLESELFSIREVDLGTLAIITGGDEVQGKVVMHGRVTEDVTIELSSSDEDAAILRGGGSSGEKITVTVLAGQKDTSFTVVTKPVPATQNVTISAQVVGSSKPSKTKRLTVQQPSYSNPFLHPDPISPGGVTRCGVSLNGRAPAGMELVVDSSHNEFVRLRREVHEQWMSLPRSVLVGEGQLQTEFDLHVIEDISNQTPAIEAIVISVSYREEEPETTELHLRI